MFGGISDDTLAAVKAAQSRGEVEAVLRAAGISVAQNLTYYNLEPIAKGFFPVNTPLRKRFPRKVMKGDTAVRWKAVTDINVATVQSPGVSEGNRNSNIAITTKEYLSSYATLGMDNFITFEAEAASEGFDDAKAIGAWNMLASLMIGEERTLLGGNKTVALGTPATPTLTDNTADGGSIGQTITVKVYVVALTSEGYRLSPAYTSMATYYTAITNDVLTLENTRTNADGSTDLNTGYNSAVSAVASVTTATDGNSAHTVSASTTPIAGAVAYAWFWGATVGAGSTLGAITTVANVKITTATGAGTTAANNAGIASDKGKNPLLFDGLISIIAGAGPEVSASTSGAYIQTVANGVAGVGTALTSDGAGGVTQIETALKTFFARYRFVPDNITVSGQQMLDLRQLVIAGGAAALWRFQMDASRVDAFKQGLVGGGVVIGFYLSSLGGAVSDNPTMGKLIPVTVHPDLAPGTILFDTSQVPYPMPNVENLLRVALRGRDYYQIEYPVKTRKYEYGVYVEETLQSYAPFTLGMIHNVASTN